MIVKSFYTGPLEVNCYVATDEKTKESFIVDPGGESPALTEYIKKNDFDVKYIILTHGHGDHIGGVKKYADLYHAPIYAFDAEQMVLADPNQNFSREVLGVAVSFNADRYLKVGEDLTIGEKKVTIIHTPGHSPGGICILVDDVLFSGDTLFAGSIGRSDFQHSSTKDLMDSLRNKLACLDEHIHVYPGHGPETTIGDEKKFNPFL